MARPTTPIHSSNKGNEMVGDSLVGKAKQNSRSFNTARLQPSIETKKIVGSCGRYTGRYVFLFVAACVLSFHNFHDATVEYFRIWRYDDVRHEASKAAQAHHGTTRYLEKSLDSGIDDPKICFITSQYVRSPDHADKLVEVRSFLPKLANSPSVRFFAFTNVHGLKAPGWTIILKTFGTQFKRFVTQSRWPKFQAFHEPVIKDQCEVVFYMDGDVILKNSLNDYLFETKRILNSQAQLSQLRHNRLNLTVDKEFKRILSSKKDIQKNVDKSLEWLHAQPDFINDCQMYANHLFGYALNSTAFISTANFFWSHYSKEEDSWRDQPLWCYSLHHTGTNPLSFPNSLFRLDQSRKGMNGHTYSIHNDSVVQKATIKSTQ